MKRREFISLVGGVAAWPLTARAQQGERMRRIGALVLYAEADPQGKPRVAAFLQGLQTLGWTEGRNVQIDIRWRGRRREISQIRGGNGRACAGRHSDRWQRSYGGSARSDPHVTDRVRERKRPGRRWVRLEPGATWRQRHRVYLSRIRREREMA